MSGESSLLVRYGIRGAFTPASLCWWWPYGVRLLSRDSKLTSFFVSQGIKVFDFFQYLLLPSARSAGYTTKWILVDFLYCAVLSQLRIPRLNYTKSVVVLQIVFLCISDAFLFGGITVNLGFGGTWKLAPTFGSSGAPHPHSQLAMDTNNLQ